MIKKTAAADDDDDLTRPSRPWRAERERDDDDHDILNTKPETLEYDVDDVDDGDDSEHRLPQCGVDVRPVRPGRLVIGSRTMALAIALFASFFCYGVQGIQFSGFGF